MHTHAGSNGGASRCSPGARQSLWPWRPVSHPSSPKRTPGGGAIGILGPRVDDTLDLLPYSSFPFHAVQSSDFLGSPEKCKVHMCPYPCQSFMSILGHRISGPRALAGVPLFKKKGSRPKRRQSLQKFPKGNGAQGGVLPSIRVDHLWLAGGKACRVPPPPASHCPPPPSRGPALTLSPRISPRCSCRRRFTSRMRLLWSSIALTFSASARRRLRISSSLLHCSSSSSDTLDRSSTAAADDGPAGAGAQLSAACADMVPAREPGCECGGWTRGSGFGETHPAARLCARPTQRHRPGAAAWGRQGSRCAAILPRPPQAPPGSGRPPRLLTQAPLNFAQQVHDDDGGGASGRGGGGLLAPSPGFRTVTPSPVSADRHEPRTHFPSPRSLQPPARLIAAPNGHCAPDPKAAEMLPLESGRRGSLQPLPGLRGKP